MPSYYTRQLTPPPLREAIFDGNDPPCPWRWEDDGGGMTLTFGKHQGQKMYDTSLTYLRFVREKCPYKRPFCHAFDKYYAGLRRMANTHWKDFIVPFGQKHHGKTIRQCRDKPWFLWAQSKQVLRDKHPLFFRAVKESFKHPRHYEVTRDIGKLTLRASDYEQDIEGYMNGSDEDDTLPEEPTDSDLEFIANSDEDPEIYDSDNSLDRLDEEAEKVTDQLKAASPSKTTKILPETVKSALKDIRASFKATRPFRLSKSPQKKANKAVRTKRKPSTPDSFIEDDSSDEEASYADFEESEASDATPPTPRITRSRARAYQENVSKADSSEDEREEDDAIVPSLRNLPSATSASTSASPRNIHLTADSTLSQESDNELPKSPCQPRRARKIISETSEDESSEPSTPVLKNVALGTATIYQATARPPSSTVVGTATSRDDAPVRGTTEKSEKLPVKPPKSRRTRKQIISVSDKDDEASGRSSPSRLSVEQRERGTTEESEVLLVKPPKRSRRAQSQIILESDDDDRAPEPSSPPPRLLATPNRLSTAQRMKCKGKAKANNEVTTEAGQSRPRTDRHTSPTPLRRRRQRNSSDEDPSLQQPAKRRHVME